MEYGPTDEVLRAPKTSYTQELIEAAPVADPAVQAEKRKARLRRRKAAAASVDPVEQVPVS
ncbi:hypothetical protein GCM10025864_19520 [Luteimicrobium album]|uniref:Oligopeptide/dipeptide ABC transporter C-terminal domain-containing protein n=1 Tax=Luteimicrobium album TaxID=1054550 RepID=A0ABQ6I0C7_9MICO|nr:hypothetical protein GCM10025864_19520 [Luteimicrobium album]